MAGGRQAYRAKHGTHRKKLDLGLLGIVVLIVIGVLVILYPTISDALIKIQIRSQQDAYLAEMDALSQEDRATARAQADAYNQHLAESKQIITDSYATGTLEGNVATTETLVGNQPLYIGRTLAELDVPTADIRLPVRVGDTDAVIRSGVGIVSYTSLPFGGAGTHSVLTAHSGLPQVKLFDNLHDVKVGDIFYLRSYGTTLAYRTKSVKTVEPDETAELLIVPGEDLVTLLTCTPIGVNSHRLLVLGERIPLDEALQESGKEPFEQQCIFSLVHLILLAVVGLGVLVLLFFFMRRRSTQEEET